MKATTRKTEWFEFDTQLEASCSKIYMAHLPVPNDVAQVFTEGGGKRVVCELRTENGSVEYQCGLIPNGEGTFVIMVNKERRERLGLTEGFTVKARLKADDSEYGLPMPEELEEALRQDPEADAFLRNLPPGKRRSLLYIVSTAKSSDKRIQKSLIILEHLKTLRGKIDYKRLHEELKQSSFQKGML